jgi:hypothetical protein
MEMEMLLPPMQEKTEMEWKPILMVQEMLYMPGYTFSTGRARQI